MVNRLITVHEAVALLQSAKPIELLMSVTAGAASIVSGTRSDTRNVAGQRGDQQHSAFCTCDQGDASHCPARDTL